MLGSNSFGALAMDQEDRAEPLTSEIEGGEIDVDVGFPAHHCLHTNVSTVAQACSDKS
jgi:hypothetical protein